MSFLQQHVHSSCNANSRGYALRRGRINLPRCSDLKQQRKQNIQIGNWQIAIQSPDPNFSKLHKTGTHFAPICDAIGITQYLVFETDILYSVLVDCIGTCLLPEELIMLNLRMFGCPQPVISSGSRSCHEGLSFSKARGGVVAFRQHVCAEKLEHISANQFPSGRVRVGFVLTHVCQ